MQTLNDHNVPPTHIMQLSGHKNVQSVNNYSNISKEQQKNMSLILSGNTSTEKFAPSPVSSLHSAVAECESSFTKSSSLPAAAAAGPLSGAVIHGGQFNITINTINKSPSSRDAQFHDSFSSTRTFKRIKRVFESSDDDDSPPAH